MGRGGDLILPLRVNDSDSCPVCRRNFKDARQLADGYLIDCQLCGEYEITASAVASNLPADVRQYLSCHTRQAWVLGRTRAAINSANREQLAEPYRYTTVIQKLEKLLRLVEARAPQLGHDARIEPEWDYPLVDGTDAETLRYLIKHANQAGYLEFKELSNISTVKLTVAGWQHLDPGSGGAGIRGRVFIAMWFDPSMDEVYDVGIKPALELDCKLTAIRIDKVHHNEKICDKILAEIRRCQFTVADFTGQNQGVYFEAGFAMGIGREVIRTCRDDEMRAKKLHFDTRQYPHIVWATPKELRERLAERIQASKLC